VLINIDGYLVLTALCRATSEGGTFAGDRHCHLHVEANLHISALWTQPPSSPFPQPDQRQNALSLGVESGGIFDHEKAVEQNLFRGFDLRYTFFLMPPNGAALFEVACSLWCDISDGKADCPGLSHFFVTLAILRVSPSVTPMILYCAQA